MGQTMELRLRQHMTLTPQLQQALRLLQLSSLEFEQEMRAALTANPFLEDEEEAEDAPSVTQESPPEPATVEADASASGDDDPVDARLGFEDLPRAAAAHDDDTDWTEWSEARLTRSSICSPTSARAIASPVVVSGSVPSWSIKHSCRERAPTPAGSRVWTKRSAASRSSGSTSWSAWTSAASSLNSTFR